jgi:hypothetical protein
MPNSSNAFLLVEHKEVAPPDDATACPSSRIPWEFYKGGRIYTDEQIDSKVGALFANALLNGRDIIAHGAQISALATAVFNHVQNHGGTSVDLSRAEFEGLVASLRLAQDMLEARLVAAAEALNG